MIKKALSIPMVYYVVSNMRPRDADMVWALTGKGVKQAADDFAVRVAGRKNGFVFCAPDGDPVTVFLADETRPGVWTSTMVSTPRVDEIIKDITRFICRDFVKFVQQAGAHRYEMLETTDPAVARWMKFIGCEQEAVLRRAGRDGRDLAIYAYSKPLNDPEVPDEEQVVRWRKAGEIA